MDFNDFITRTDEFMAANLVVLNFQPDPNRPTGPKMDGVHPMTLVASGQCQDAHGGAIDKWRIERPDAYNGGPNGPTVFQAYWCSYSPDELHLQVVESAADLMFTPRMDGCSFGVGAATPSGARFVGHANVSRASADQVGFDAQQDAQNTQLTRAIGHLDGGIDASTYSPLGSGQSGVTYGVRDTDSGAWSFHTLVYSGNGVNARHLGIQDIA